MNKNIFFKLSVLVFSLALFFGAFFGCVNKSEAMTADECYSAYENCYNNATDDEEATACENSYNSCEASTTDTGTTTDSNSWTQSECVAAGNSWENGECMETFDDCSQYPGTVAENGDCVPADSDGFTETTCAADGGSWVNGNCMESTGSDCSQYPGTVADANGDCVQANSEASCSQTDGVWKDGACYATKDEYCQKTMDPTYSWSTMYQTCVGGLGTECVPNASPDVCYGVPCACTASPGGSLGGTCQGSGCRSTPTSSTGTDNGNSGDGLGGLSTGGTTTTQATTINGISIPVGSTVNSDGSVISPTGTQLLPPGSATAPSSPSGNFTFCTIAMTGAQICDNSVPVVVSTGSGLPGSYTSGFGGVVCGAGFAQIGGVCFPTNTGLSAAPIYVILSNLFSWLMGLFTTFAVLAFVISGIQYLTSAGDEGQIETAKHNATYSLLGVVIGLSGFVIVQAIASALSGQSYLF